MVDSPPRDPVDPAIDAIRAACGAGDWDGAATRVLGRYGQELIEYLVATAGDEMEGGDAYALCAERVWRGLIGFRWESSLRTWCYVVARSALVDVKRQVRPGHQPLSGHPALARLVDEGRTATRTYRRTESRQALATARAALDPEDRELLVLRIDRGLPWRDVARVLSGGDELDAAALTRRSAALRKRFEGLKARLREAVRSATAPEKP